MTPESRGCSRRDAAPPTSSLTGCLSCARLTQAARPAGLLRGSSGTALLLHPDVRADRRPGLPGPGRAGAERGPGPVCAQRPGGAPGGRGLAGHALPRQRQRRRSGWSSTTTWPTARTQGSGRRPRLSGSRPARSTTPRPVCCAAGPGCCCTWPTAAGRTAGSRSSARWPRTCAAWPGMRSATGWFRLPRRLPVPAVHGSVHRRGWGPAQPGRRALARGDGTAVPPPAATSGCPGLTRGSSHTDVPGGSSRGLGKQSVTTRSN